MLVFEQREQLLQRHAANIIDLNQLGAAPEDFSAIGVLVPVAFSPIAVSAPIATGVLEIVFFDCLSYSLVKESGILLCNAESDFEDGFISVRCEPQQRFLDLAVGKRVAE